MIIIIVIMNLLNRRYNIQWYRIPLQQQKLILFILHRSMRSCKLVAGNIFVLSLEGFGSVMKSTVHCEILSDFQQ